MKKILLVMLLLVFMFLLLCYKQKECSADTYQNLIDESNIKYYNGNFYYDVPIYLDCEKTYSVVMSFAFLGDATTNEEIEWSVTALDNDTIPIGLSFVFKKNTSMGIYYSEMSPERSCSMVINNMGPKGFTSLSELKTGEIIMFEGGLKSFKGFKAYVPLDGYDYVSGSIDLYTDFDKPIETETISSFLRGYDNVDGIITPVLISDSYGDMKTVGKHQIIYSLEDSRKNKSNLVVNVYVIDKKAPIISGPSRIEWAMELDAPTLDDLKDNFVFTDNADGTLDSTNISLDYTELKYYQKGKVGTYRVTIKAIDSSGNEASHTFILAAVDNEAPELELKDSEIKMSELGNYIENDLFEVLVKSVSDNSGKYYLEYSITLDANDDNAGRYLVIVIAYDDSNNKTTKTAYLTIADDINPEFFAMGTLLKTTSENPYTYESLVSAIKENLDDRGLLYDSVYVLKTDYFQNENNLGTYNVNYLYSYEGSSNYEVASVIVTNKDDNTSKIASFSVVALIPIAVGVAIFLIAKGKKKNIR